MPLKSTKQVIHLESNCVLFISSSFRRVEFAANFGTACEFSPNGAAGTRASQTLVAQQQLARLPIAAAPGSIHARKTAAEFHRIDRIFLISPDFVVGEEETTDWTDATEEKRSDPCASVSSVKSVFAGLSSQWNTDRTDATDRDRSDPCASVTSVRSVFDGPGG